MISAVRSGPRVALALVVRGGSVGGGGREGGKAQLRESKAADVSEPRTEGASRTESPTDEGEGETPKITRDETAFEERGLRGGEVERSFSSIKDRASSSVRTMPESSL